MSISRRRFLTITGAAALAATTLGEATIGSRPVKAQEAQPLGPGVTPYPLFIDSQGKVTDRNGIIAEAQRISDALESYVKDWLDGKVPAEIPANLLPKGIDTTSFPSFRLVRPNEITAEDQWIIREAQQIDLNATQGQFPDPHCTYLFLPSFYAPFGSKVIVEGQFPHARFMSIQATPSLHPENYREGAYGVGEVPIVDVDIEPEPGHTNPFRTGAARNGLLRSYRVTFDLAIGNPAELNPAFRPPFFRAPGNNRIGGALIYQGPYGAGYSGGHGRGVWDVGQLWIRYYAPDKAMSPLGGVPLPKLSYQLPDGRQYYIQADLSVAEKNANLRKPAPWTWPGDPLPADGSQGGWGKRFGIFRSVYTGVALNVAWLNWTQKYVRDLDKGVTGRGEDVPAPGNYSVGATECPYISYLVRGMALNWGKVAVLTGKLPTTPRTRDGEPVMEPAQARYWSLTANSNAYPDADGYVGAVLHSIMDDEIVTDTQGRYVIVLSRDFERPSNATAENGVTWVNWGPSSQVNWNIRWLAVNPDTDSSITPNDAKLGWEADWASTKYNKALIGENNHTGLLGEYLPQVHYLGKDEFEKLGTAVTPDQVPIWK